MKVTHISDTLMEHKKAGLTLMRLLKELSVIEILPNYENSVSLDNLPNSLDGISVYYNTAYNSQNVGGATQITNFVKSFLPSYIQPASIMGLPKKSRTWYIKIPNKNSIMLGVNVFLPLNHIITEKEKIHYLEILFRRYLNNIIGKMEIKDLRKIEIDNLSKFFIKNISIAKKSVLRSKENYQKNIKYYEEKIIHEYNKLTQVMKSLHNIKKLDKFEDGFIKTQLQLTASLPFVKSIKFNTTNQCLDVYVGKIHIEDIYIGDFCISVYPDQIKFYNMDNSYNEYCHPHVEGHYACFGTGHIKVYELLGSYKIQPLIFLCYQFLKSYNRDDCYINLSDWQHRDEDY